MTYAGFNGEIALLEELYKRGMQQPEVAPGLRAGDGMLFSGITTDRALANARRGCRDAPSASARMPICG